MKIRKMLACIIATVMMIVNVTNVYAAEEVVKSGSGKVFSKYTTSASVTWNQSTVCLSAYTSSSAPNAGYATYIVGHFTFFGIGVGGEMTDIGTTSARIYGTGNGYLAVGSMHEVSYANDVWKCSL